MAGASSAFQLDPAIRRSAHELPLRRNGAARLNGSNGRDAAVQLLEAELRQTTHSCLAGKPILLIKTGQLWLRAARKNASAPVKNICAEVQSSAASSLRRADCPLPVDAQGWLPKRTDGLERLMVQTVSAVLFAGRFKGRIASVLDLKAVVAVSARHRSNRGEGYGAATPHAIPRPIPAGFLLSLLATETAPTASPTDGRSCISASRAGAPHDNV